MRTFIIGIILSIESQYNFIHLTTGGFGCLVIILFLIFGVIFAIAQDIKGLLK